MSAPSGLRVKFMRTPDADDASLSLQSLNDSQTPLTESDSDTPLTGGDAPQADSRSLGWIGVAVLCFAAVAGGPYGIEAAVATVRPSPLRNLTAHTTHHR